MAEFADAVDPSAWDFFLLVRFLECLASDRPRLGKSLHAADDLVRFCQDGSLAFPPTAIARFERREGGAPPRLFQHFFGLLGCNGPMPLRFAEYVHGREKQDRDPTWARFLDMFNHRMLCLFYRAWAASQQTVSFDRGDDPFGVYIASLIGIGTEALRRRDVVPDVAKLHYSGRLVCPTPNAEGLCAVLEGYFGQDVELEPFVGQWVELPPQAHCRLGESPDTGTLGLTCIAGERVWDCQSRFRLRFGPMSIDDYRSLLPGRAGCQRLVAWVRGYVGLTLQWDAQLILRAEDVPDTKLGEQGELGWTTWLRSGAAESDASDLVLGPF